MAASVATQSAQERLGEALTHFRAGSLDEAGTACRAVLAAEPDNVDALDLMGQVLLQARQAPFAVPLLERAAALRPDFKVLSRLGHALREVGDTAASEDVLRRAADTNPESCTARTQLGITLLELRRTAEALEQLREAVRLRPQRSDAHFWLANALVDAGERDAARASFGSATRLEDRWRLQHLALGRSLFDRGRPEDALRLYRWGLALTPGEPELTHMVAALSGDCPARASDAYLASHFDRFAENFDSVLVDKLEYRAPELAVAAAKRVLAAGHSGELSVLDAGCGTGLCAPLLRPLAGHLVGIDVSPGMLERAAERGSYDELLTAELTEALPAQPERYDLIVATDVLIYFGDLHELLRAMSVALRPRGVVAVSIELHDGDGFALTSTGRYTHSAAHLRHAASAAGLELVELEDCRLRRERGQDVAGQIAVLSRAA